MSTLVLSLVLLAAFAHAGWNLLAKHAQGGAAFVWLSAVAGTVLWIPALAVALAVDPGRLGWSAAAVMAGSGALHALYFVLLQRGYKEGDLSLVYPLARGTGPLLSTAAAIVVLGERPSALALAGAALIVASVLALAPRGGDGRGARFAVLTGMAIAAYTLWDKQAVGALALSPIVYYWGTNLANAALLTPATLRRGAELRRAWSSSRRQALGIGVLSPSAAAIVAGVSALALG